MPKINVKKAISLNPIAQMAFNKQEKESEQAMDKFKIEMNSMEFDGNNGKKKDAEN